MSYFTHYLNMNLRHKFTFCTLCLSKERNLLHVFDHNERDIRLAIVIRELLQFEVVQGKRIPWKICKNCFIKLNDFQHFKSHAKKCKEYLDHTFLHGRRHLDSTLEDELPTDDTDEDDMLSNESFTNEDGIVSQMEAMDNVNDQAKESHPTQTAASVLKPVEVFVDVDVALASGEMTEEERDPLGDEDVDSDPLALITTLDQGASREEGSAPIPTENAFAFCGVKQDMGDNATEISAMTITETSVKRKSSNVTVVSCADVVGAAVDGGGEGVGGFQQTMEAENNFNALLATGHHSSARPQQGTIVTEATISHWMQRGASLNSQNDGEDTKEGIGSVPHSITQRNAGVRTEREDDSKTLIRDISNGAFTGDDESEGGNFNCNECGKVFRTKGLLRRHVKVHHGTEVLEYGDCHLEFSERSEHERHQSVQNGISISKERRQIGVDFDPSGLSKGKAKIRKRTPFICHNCNYTYTEKRNLEMHIKTIHLKQRDFSCDICHKSFGHKQHLKIHMRYHSGVKPYTCSHCQRGFAQSGHLKKHIRSVHEMERPHTCNECGKTFSQKTNLQVHMLVHTGEKPHTCRMCSKSFSQRCTLKAHMRSHTQEKPHACNVCAKRFSFKHHLKAHSSVHTGERPHACNVCAKTFAQKTHLKVHMLIHTMDMPHTCYLCSRKFRHKVNLTKHIAAHARRAPHPCNLCANIFISRFELRKHLAEHVVE